MVVLEPHDSQSVSCFSNTHTSGRYKLYIVRSFGRGGGEVTQCLIRTTARNPLGKIRPISSLAAGGLWLRMRYFTT